MFSKSCPVGLIHFDNILPGLSGGHTLVVKNVPKCRTVEKVLSGINIICTRHVTKRVQKTNLSGNTVLHGIQKPRLFSVSRWPNRKAYTQVMQTSMFRFTAWYNNGIVYCM